MAMDTSGPKWEAIMPIFGSEPDAYIHPDFYGEAKTRLNFYTAEQLANAATAFTEARRGNPRWWSHLAEFLPKRERKSEGGAKKEQADNPNKAWWGNEGEWGGDWSKVRGFDMIPVVATMSVYARSKHQRQRAAELERLAVNQGADPKLIQKAKEWAKDRGQITISVVMTLAKEN